MQLIKSERNRLLGALSAVVGVVERRHTLPILSNLLISNQGGELILLATDLELQVSTRLEAEAESDFAITVGARKLFDIVRALPEAATVRIDSRDSQVVVSAGKTRFTLQTLPASDFPRVETGVGLSEPLTLSQRVLKRLIQHVQFAMASQDIRYYLNGMLMVLEPGTLRVVATDGHRLASAEAPLEGEFANRELIIPRKTVLELSKLLADSDDPVTLRLGSNQITLSLPGVELVSKLIDGKFPDYRRVIPGEQPRRLVADRQTLIQAMQRAAILSNEKFKGVRLVMSEHTLGIACSNTEQEEAADEIEVEFSGEPLDIGFNVTYLLDGLAAVSTPQAVLSFGDANSSMLLTSPEDAGFRYVVMPMRI